MLLDVLNRTDDALGSDRSYKIKKPSTAPIGSQGACGRQQFYKRAELANISSKLIRRRECECDEGHTQSVEFEVVRLMEPQF